MSLTCSIDPYTAIYFLVWRNHLIYIYIYMSIWILIYILYKYNFFDFLLFSFLNILFLLNIQRNAKNKGKIPKKHFFSWIEVVDVKDRRSIIINNITWKSSNWDWRKLKWSYIIEAPLIISICFIIKYIQFKILHNYYF